MQETIDVISENNMSDRRLKILIIPSWYPNDLNRVNGTFIEEQAKAVALYHEVFVFYPYFYPLALFIKRLLKNEKNRLINTREGGLDVARVRIPFFKVKIRGLDYLFDFCFMFAYLMTSIFVFTRLKKAFTPDIIHCHVTLPAGLLGALISKIFNIPLIISEHAGPFSQIVPTVLHKRAAKYSIDRAEIILPVSNALKKEIDSFFTIKRFEIVPNTVDSNVFYSKIRKSREIKKNILFVGLFHEIKGIPVLLEAIHLLYKDGINDFRLHIVGDNDRRLMHRYKHMSDILNINDLVFFHGQKTKEEVSKFMQNSDFLVLPSFAETFGCVIIEALSCGRPVLATKCGGPEELITKENGLLVATRDAVSLKNGLKFMLDNYQKFDAEKISRDANTLYSHKKVGERLSTIYLSIITKM